MSEEFVFTTKLTNGDLSKMESNMESMKPIYSAVIHAKKLTVALEAFMPILSANGVDCCVKLTVNGDTMLFSIDNEIGETSAEISGQKAVGAVEKELYYNPKLILAFVKSCSGEINLKIDKSGILKLKSAVTDYVIISRRPPKIKKMTPPINKQPETKPKKSTKGKPAKNPAA